MVGFLARFYDKRLSVDLVDMISALVHTFYLFKHEFSFCIIRAGSVPARLLKLHHLRYLDIDGNQCSGKDSDSLCGTLHAVLPLIFNLLIGGG